MRLLIPLGLLGLLGIVALIIIYIIKPNFQQKLISSTFIWRLSLKFKKRKIPISRLRNILLVLCQILIIVTASFILAKSVVMIKEQLENPESVIIIDSSASMRTGSEDISRYERAVNEAIKQVNATFDKDGIVSVIIADDKNTFLAERAFKDSRDRIVNELNALIDKGEDGELGCSYSSSDIQAAVTLSDSILSENPAAKIFVYTDKNYANVSGNVTLVNVAETEEWNAAILNATAEYEDNYYTFRVQIACFGRDSNVDVALEIFGANAENSEDISAGSVTLSEQVSCASDQIYTVIFKYIEDDPDDEIDSVKEYEKNLPENCILHALTKEERVFSYESVHIGIDSNDSMILDNNFDIYGGMKELIKIQYYSAGKDPNTGKELLPNPFFQEVLAALAKAYAGKWDIQITEVKTGSTYATEGFDFYIFEHTMPETLPTDGVVLLSDIQTAPKDSGLQIDGIVDMSRKSVFLAADTTNPILQNTEPTNITVSRYTKVTYDANMYTSLLSYAGDPMLLVRNDSEAKVAVMCFSLHYSNLPTLIEFPLMMYNMLEYFIPATVKGNSFETQQKFTLNCRGDKLSVTGYNTDLSFEEFPAELTMTVPGTYTLKQTTFSGKEVVEKIYVRMPMAESNITANEDTTLVGPYYEIDESEFYNDLLLWLACALVALIMLEWYLQHKESSI